MSGNKRRLYRWDIKDQAGRPKPTELDKDDGTAAIAVSPVGSNLVIAYEGQGTIRLLDLNSNQVVRSYDVAPGDNPFTPVFSADGAVLAVPTALGFIHLLHPDLSGPLREPLRHGGVPVRAIAMSPKPGLLASGGFDSIIKLWDLKSFTVLATLKGHREHILSAAFSPDGKLLATSGGAASGDKAEWEHEGEICLWDVAARNLLRRFTAHCGSTACVLFTPDGKSLITAGRDARVHLWDVELLKAGPSDAGSADNP